MTGFSFCETAQASSMSQWHIRRLTHQGKKLGGGADTISLCGRKVAWDLNAEITFHHLQHCCRQCSESLKNVTES